MLLEINDPPKVAAKRSRQKLELRSNYYVVPREGWYHYFPMEVAPDDGKPILRFQRTPQVLVEGYAVVDKKVYEVTLGDLLRGVIRKSRIITLGTKNDNGTSNPLHDAILDDSEDPSVSATHTPVSSSDLERGPGANVGLEVAKRADDAWEEQVGTLLSTLSEEEGGEWEICEKEDSAQSGHSDEIGSVPNSDEASGQG